MKKSLFALFFVVFPVSAHAWDFEASIGRSEHSVGAAYSIGIAVPFSDSWKWRIGHASLGTPKLDTAVLQNSALDDQQARGACLTASCWWFPPQRIKEIYTTVGREFHSGGLIYGLGAGFAIYRPMQQEDMPSNDPTYRKPYFAPRINVTPVFEASVGDGKTSAVLSLQYITEYGDWENSAPPSRTFTLSVRHSF